MIPRLERIAPPTSGEGTHHLFDAFVCGAGFVERSHVREYRELEAGTRSPNWETFDRICKVYGWPQTFVGRIRS